MVSLTLITPGEFSGSGLAPDEVAPNLSLIWKPESAVHEHYSAITPDPEAQIDMRTWAKMFAKIQDLDQCDGYAYAVLAGEEIVAEFPVNGSFNPHTGKACTSIYVSFNEFMSEGTEIIGRRGFSFEFDLIRPGYVTVSEGVIAPTDKITQHDRLIGLPEIEQVDEGVYMTSEGKGVGYRFGSYVMNQPLAEKICDLLLNADPSEEDVLGQRFQNGLKLMEPNVREAVHRTHVLHKKLNRSPEEAFKEPEWWWDELPAQFARYPNLGIITDFQDRLESIAPPGGSPSDSEKVHQFIEEHSSENRGKWIKATWDKEQLPDDFDALFTEPTRVEAISPSELIATLPDEIKEKLAAWAQVSLFWRRNWVDLTMRGIDSVIDMTEEEFAERKKKHDEEGEHFYWGLHRSLRSSINTALHGANRPYEDWVAQYDQIAQDYADFYSAYAEVIQRYPHEEQPMGPSLWKSEKERGELYQKVFRAYQKMAELPEDSPEESSKDSLS